MRGSCKIKGTQTGCIVLFPGNNTYLCEYEKITPEKVLHLLKTGENEIHAKPETEGAAKNALARMLELAGK